MVVADDFPATGWLGVHLQFQRDRDVLVALAQGTGDVRAWSVPERRELRRLTVEAGDYREIFVRGEGFFSSTRVGNSDTIRRGLIAEGDLRTVGSMFGHP